jgi:hypothetical protein
MSNIVIGDKLVSFKFIDKKIGLKKNYFEQLYRHFKSACNKPQEEENINKFCIFSPISKEKIEINIKEVVEK